MNRSVEVLPDKETLIARSLSLVLSQIQGAIATQGRCMIALSGGSTPKPLYEAIASENLPWENIHIFWGDERYVPADHADSNQRMARQAWLDRVPLPPENIHPMPTGSGDPVADAEKHEKHLQTFFQVLPGEFPAFDIILLGMGDDGHTASLFPHTEALDVRDRLITVGNKDGQPRLTFTVPLINHGRCVIFVVAGAAKQTALAEIFSPTGDSRTYPSRLIQPTGQLWWLLDAAAGENLQQEGGATEPLKPS